MQWSAIGRLCNPAHHRTIFPMVSPTAAAERTHMVRSAPHHTATFSTNLVLPRVTMLPGTAAQCR